MMRPDKGSARRDAVRLLLATLLALLLTVGAAAAVFPPFWSTDGNLSGSPPELSDSIRIDVNQAGVRELCCLPGIGPALAMEIISYREQHGPYHFLTEMWNIEGIDAHTILSWGSMAYISEQYAEGF